MKLTKEHLYNLLMELPVDLICDYVLPGEFTVKRKNSNSHNDVHFTLLKNGVDTGKDVPITESAMETMISSIQENRPISIDAALINGGNKRSAIEGALIRTSEFYSIQKGRNKNIVWVPSAPHKIGEKGIWPENEPMPSQAGDVDSSLSFSESFDVKDDETNDSIKEDYIWFLKNCSSTPKSWSNYSDFARINSSLAKINGTDSFDIYDYRSIDAVELLISKISSDEEFIEYNKKGGNQYSNALQHYLRFIRARQHFRSKTAKAAQPTPSPLPLQRIYYGSPGTGKSHEVNEIAKGHPGRFIRTTFHPDSDYASFVGAYKPVTQKRGGQVRSDYSFGELAALLKKEYSNAEKKVVAFQSFILKHADYFNGKIDNFNRKAFCREAGVPEGYDVEINDTVNLNDWLVKNGYLAKTDSITYSFVPQAFLKAYCNAWKALDEPYHLIIEEINRGNCAQIFGDLFQLLDRNAEGLSKYGIEADDDIRRFIDGDTELGFGALAEEQKTAIRDAVSGSKDLENITAGDIISGKTLCLPPNLHILATMNTSDQSLFPMDSAFKRRWEWKYVPTTPPKGAEKSMRMEVKEEKTAYGKTVNVGSYSYSWTEFLDKINERILQATHSEDKQLGFWFVGGAEVKEISVSTFVSKVVFYLWNDVFKDFGAKESNPFSVNVDGKYSLMSFNKFFEINAEGKTVENLGVLHRFMGNVGLTPEPEYVPQDKEEDILANEGMDQDNGDTIDAQAPEASSADTEPAE